MTENRSLQETHQQDVKVCSRLSLHNEELQYKLKVNSEKFTAALHELSGIYPDQTIYLSECKKSLYGSSQEIISTPAGDRSSSNRQTSGGSPPTSPVVKGVVEKSDSMSYVLEVHDDESAEALAERLMKRGGSFRGSVKERQSVFKRQLSLGANALMQSASATSVLRRISEAPVKHSEGTPTRSSARTRSNSLNVSCDPDASCSKWTDAIQGSSTPVLARINKKLTNGHGTVDRRAMESLTRSSSVSTEDADDDVMVSSQRSATARFNVSKRHPIKEAGGEAMVAQRSCTNSEDERSLGSESMSGSPSNSTSPSHSDGVAKARQLSMDDALMHQIVASLSTRSTPMEVSWSEDGDNDPFGAQNESNA